MSTTTILILQGIASALQVVSVSIATMHVNPVIPVTVSAILAGVQTILQHVGNKAPGGNTEDQQ